ncbi:MAG: hypothetical protein ACE5EY_16410 [Anaerolineae bacterium]
MILLPATHERGIMVVIGLPDKNPILELIVQLALLHPVQVIVGGNRFDAHQLARIIRRHTVQLDQTLARIQQARPFTCYQALKLLEDTKPTTPLVAIDLLITFYDENISDSESIRLVNIAITHLRRLGQQSPVLVTLRPSVTSTRSGLTNLIQNIADEVFVFDFPQESFQPPLF